MMMTATSSPETHNSGALAKLGLIFMGSLCSLQPTNADEPAKQQPIKVFISPEWRHGIQLALIHCHTRTQAPQLPFT
jgi:hypothetical protein